MKIYIDGLSCRASVGVFDWEKKVLQNLILDLEIDVLNQPSVASDAIEDTLSYKDLSKVLIAHVQSQHFGLIERIAGECCQLVLDYDARVTRVLVQVSKPGALSVSTNVRVSEQLTRNQVIIGLGSNIEPEHHIAEALSMLQQEFDLVSSASHQRTKAIARDQHPDFINTAVVINTGLTMKSLTRRLKHMEWEIGRKHCSDSYAARVIDLDILLWNQHLEDADILSRDFLRQSIEELIPGIVDTLNQRYALTLNKSTAD